MKSSAASIRAKLMNLARNENISFQLIIIRYLQERFLFRLSISRFSANFLLKGGALLYALEGSKTRSTKDIDFLGKNISNESKIIRKAFIEICAIDNPADCVWFDANSIISQTITDQEKYPGIRIFVDAGFDTIQQRLQIDIGFGDIVSPSPVKIDYPLLISNLQAPKLFVYSIETVIAEKFQAMIELSTANSRMKDFYDVYQLIKSDKFNKIGLQIAIKSTFGKRETPYYENHALFEEEFYQDANRVKMWKSFLKKARLNKELDFAEVVIFLTKELKPYWELLNPLKKG